MKRSTTFGGAPTARNQAEKRWLDAWRDLPQESIQQWIEAVLYNIQQVIRLEGGNEYIEGRDTKRSWKGRRRLGELFKHIYVPNGAREAYDEGFYDTDEAINSQDEEVDVE